MLKRVLTLAFLRMGTGAIAGMLLADAVRTRDWLGFGMFMSGVYLGFKYL